MSNEIIGNQELANPGKYEFDPEHKRNPEGEGTLKFVLR